MKKENTFSDSALSIKDNKESISPIVNMEKLIMNMMTWSNVSIAHILRLCNRLKRRFTLFNFDV